MAFAGVDPSRLRTGVVSRVWRRAIIDSFPASRSVLALKGAMLACLDVWFSMLDGGTGGQNKLRLRSGPL